MDKFINPENGEEIIKELSESSDSKETEEIINTYFPGWLLYSMEEYSKDYPHLQVNWKYMAGQAKQTPQKIIIVADIKFDADHSVIMTVCEYMTRHGYCVRRLGEFFPCRGCNRAIPCVEIWKNLKDRKLPVPEVWSEKCTGC